MFQRLFAHAPDVKGLRAKSFDIYPSSAEATFVVSTRTHSNNNNNNNNDNNYKNNDNNNKNNSNNNNNNSDN